MERGGSDCYVLICDVLFVRVSVCVLDLGMGFPVYAHDFVWKEEVDTQES